MTNQKNYEIVYANQATILDFSRLKLEAEVVATFLFDCPVAFAEQ